jgi:large subunit ribosomal protein L23
MPLFGFRKDKKHEQSHIQAQAGLAKNAAAADRKKSKVAGAGKIKSSVKPEKISGNVVTKDVAALKAAPAMPVGHFTSATDSIIRPRVTEKSGLLSQGGVYTFEVTRNSNKAMVAKAVKALYKVTPVKIAIINTPMKNVFVKGRKGTVSGMKKAIITVKKGEKIDFV